jgi:branched-chain amino acid aminotransferase
MVQMGMSAVVNVNGRITGAEEAVVSVFDHGFLYGEGVYETLRTYNRRPFLFDRHARRLRRSAQMIALHVPFSDEELVARVRDTMAAAHLDGEAYIRVLLTRGVGELTYELSATPAPSLVIIVKPQVDPAPDAYEAGVRVVMVSIVRNHPASLNPAIKSNNLMNSALAMQEAYRRGGFEGVMRNYRGEIAECTTSNLFIVKGGVALTPPLDSGLLPGITRELLFEVGRGAGIEVRESALRDQDLLGANEAFLTSTTREVVPITRIDDHTIGSGRPGPVTAALLAGFRRVAHQA